MQTLKISCIQCPKHTECPYKTRLYVNYCGTDQKKVGPLIRAAHLECRARKGRLFLKEFLVAPAARSVFLPATAVPIAS